MSQESDDKCHGVRVERKGNRRSLHCATPDFLSNLVALTELMRLSLGERRTRDLIQCSVAGNPGRDDKKERDVVRRGGCLKAGKPLMGFAPQQRRVPWQRSSPYNDPLLFVIPSEAEGSAVSLQVYNHPLLRANRAASIRLAAPSLLIASDK